MAETLAVEKAEFDGCGLEMPDLGDEANYRYFLSPQLEWRTQNRPEHQAQEIQKKRAGGRIHGVLVIMLAKFYFSKILLQKWDF